MKLVSVDQMRELDKRTINEGSVPGYTLMERAGRGAAGHIVDFVEGFHRRHVRRFVVLAGKGNNGGDGYVTAEELESETGKETIVFATCRPEEMGDDAARHAGRVCRKIECVYKERLSAADFRRGDIIVDALLGIGITGKPRQPYDQWIELVNQLSLPVVSLDIPSGLNGDDGSAPGACIVADMTITMGAPKKGLFMNGAEDYCGRLRLVEIGIPDEYVSAIPATAEAFFATDAANRLGRVPSRSHKGNRGYVTIIGGSKDYYGAPFLAGIAALRSGAGLARVAIPETIPALPQLPASLIVNRLTTNREGYFCQDSLKQLLPLLDQSDALVVGPGIGRHPDTAAFMEAVFRHARIPVIVDADALRLTAEYPETIKIRRNHILTPHPGEMKRLQETFCPESGRNNRMEQARKLAERTSATIVLKGNKSVVASPEGKTIVNTSGCPALATAGSGDCLTGVVAALAATTDNLVLDAATAVFIHGLAGELAPFGSRGLVADDLPDYIPSAIKYLSPLG